MDDNKSFTRVPNDLFDAILAYGFTEVQLHVVLYIIRKTEGWHKPSDIISISKMAKDIRRCRQHLSSTVSDLEKLNVITVERSGQWKASTMRVNDPDDWDRPVTESGHCPKSGHVRKVLQDTVTESGQGVSGKYDSVLSQNPDTQKKKKDTHQKKGKESPSGPSFFKSDDDDDGSVIPDGSAVREWKEEQRRNGNLRI